MIAEEKSLWGQTGSRTPPLEARPTLLKPDQQIFFPPFRLDAANQQLWRGGEPIPLRPKSFAVLQHLAERPGRLVSKDELLDAAWPETCVADTALKVCVREIREALDDEPSAPRFIETAHRRGYRFIGRVAEDGDAAVPGRADDAAARPATAHHRPLAFPAPGVIERAVDSRPSQDHPGEAPGGEQQAASATGEADASRASMGDALKQKETADQGTAGHAPQGATTTVLSGVRTLAEKIQRYKRTSLLAVLVLVTAAAGGVGYSTRRGRPSGAPAAPRRLAILPFRNLKPDAAADFLGFSLADAIITKLGHVRALVLRPSSCVARYRNQEIDLRKVADELKVNTLLSGSFLRDGDDLRITVQLVDVSANEILWQELIDLKYDKLLTVQDRVARQVVKGLHLNLAPDEAERLALDGPQDQPAYENYLLGRFLISTSNHPRAIQMLEKSVALDPDYAPAWAYLGKAYSISALQYFGGREYHGKARDAYEKALALNPAQPETRILIANFFTESGRVEEAVAILRSVVEANPNHPGARWELSYAYRYAGMLDESISEGEHALRLHPDPAGHLFNSLLYAGRYEKFVASLPPAGDAYRAFYHGLSYFYLKDRGRAAAAFNRAYALDPSAEISQIGEALRLFTDGRSRDGIELLRAAEARAGGGGAVGDGEIAYKQAQAYAVLGDKRSGLRALRHSIERGFFCYPYFVSDPLLDGLRGEAEYATLMRAARERHEEFRRKFF